MKKSIIFLMICSLLIGFSISQLINIRIANEPIDIQSQCYTNLEPSNFLSATKISVITENRIENYIKIDIKNREFFYKQTLGTGSMRPCIQKAASVILIKPHLKDITVGDVITFKCSNQEIIHRVVKIEDGIYTTKGDNNKIEDIKCITKFEDITGRLVGVLY